MFIAYIIYNSKLDKYYIGYTQDLDKRLQEHNTGISSFTSKAEDWIIKYTQLFSTREVAMKREREIKSKKSRKYIEWLLSQN